MNAETREKLAEAEERREHYLAHWLPLIPEAPPGLLPLNGVLPSLAEQRRMERELIDSIWESRRKRGDWTT